MGDAIFFSLTAVSFYALEIFITDWKLTHISPRFLTFTIALGVATSSFIGLWKAQPGTIVTPNGRDWIFILFAIVASLVADLSHFSSLNRATGTIALTLYYTMLPVAGTIFVYMFKGQLPSIRLVAAWILAALAVYLVSTQTQ